jgi:hypothetical protein
MSKTAAILAVMLLTATAFFVIGDDESVTTEFDTAGIDEIEHFVVTITPIDNESALMVTQRYHENGTLICEVNQTIGIGMYEAAKQG